MLCVDAYGTFTDDASCDAASKPPASRSCSISCAVDVTVHRSNSTTTLSLDASGNICSGTLPPSGVCCAEDTATDSCGVCGGDNTCGAAIRFNASFISGTATTLTSFQVSNALATALGVPAVSIRASTVSVVHPAGNSAPIVMLASRLAGGLSVHSDTIVSAVQRVATIGALAGVITNVRDVEVARVGDCGNGVCEYGDPDLPCPADCPHAKALCPVAYGLPCSGRGSCDASTGVCVCNAGHVGSDCSGCAADFVMAVAGGVCFPAVAARGGCSDGVRNFLETGVDCGGPDCGMCMSTTAGLTRRETVLVILGCAVGASLFAFLLCWFANKRSAKRAANVKPSGSGSKTKPVGDGGSDSDESVATWRGEDAGAAKRAKDAAASREAAQHALALAEQLDADMYDSAKEVTRRSPAPVPVAAAAPPPKAHSRTTTRSPARRTKPKPEAATVAVAAATAPAGPKRAASPASSRKSPARRTRNGTGTPTAKSGKRPERSRSPAKTPTATRHSRTIQGHGGSSRSFRVPARTHTLQKQSKHAASFVARR